MKKAIGIVLIIIGVIAFIIAGAIQVNGLILGIIKYVIPIMLFSFGASLVSRKKSSIK
jgi:hypothetical protein